MAGWLWPDFRQTSKLYVEVCKEEDVCMAKELASVRETIDLSPQEALDRAEAFLTGQGYNVAHHMFTSLTVERYVPNSTGEQEKRTITDIVQPQREGSVRLKVVGNDAEGVHEHQAEWVEWSESLPKKRPDEPKAATVEASN